MKAGLSLRFLDELAALREHLADCLDVGDVGEEPGRNARAPEPRLGRRRGVTPVQVLEDPHEQAGGGECVQVAAPRAPSRASLSPHWAFAVQLRDGASDPGGRITGRVEHVVSGRATEFASLSELVQFMRSPGGTGP
ncbi:MAG: hypothetical protein ACRELA_21465 [Candidatus Rokuibacteriota bacterium]